MNETIVSPWIALGVVGLIACLSAVLGLVLYRASAAVVERKGFRLTGATAIAWLFFLGMGRLYINVSTDLQKQQDSVRAVAVGVASRLSAEVAQASQALEECSLHVGDFQCKAPAEKLRQACQSLSAELQ